VNEKKPNRLIKETSPYLLQHAENPVDWYPWGDEALTRARTEDRPILLSIGYSACHWCHVMGHESFENEEVARLMNENFVNIKVDREERPDLDTVYMEAVQAITGSGGWPLTIFLTPEGKPFYGGTYFPLEDGRGLPGFSRVLRTVSDAYRNRRSEVERATGQIMTVLSSNAVGNATTEQLGVDILDQAYLALKLDFDSENGGFGQAPKFPQPMVLEFLLRHYYRTADKDALNIVMLTLEKMAKGGIYDQIGGGFHRYATDGYWLVPHFEKMLYDNALLSHLYLHAYLVTKTPLFRRIAEETIDYVLREMTSMEGGFYSTHDADSEGKEGKYYIWLLDEIRKALDEKTANVIIEYYGINERGNFEGQNILHAVGNQQSEEPGIIRQAKALLLKEREKRVKPGRDDKILSAWNGLMLASLTEVACVLDRNDYLEKAVANGSFLLNAMVSEGYLKHSYREGKTSTEGYLEDYAMVIEGLLNLHQATFSGKWLKEAIRLADIIVDEFWDESDGIFYDTGTRHQALFLRPRSTHDGATPSGSSSATLALMKISRLTGNQRLEKIAIKSLQNMREIMYHHPLGSGNWLCSLDFHLSAPKEIAVIGQRNNTMTMKLLRVLFNSWIPNKVVAAREPDDTGHLADLVLLENRGMINNQPTVYLCEQYSCQTPVNDPNVLREQLSRD